MSAPNTATSLYDVNKYTPECLVNNVLRTCTINNTSKTVVI